MRHLLDTLARWFRCHSANAIVENGFGCPTTRFTANTDAQRKREKERLMCGVL